MTSLGIVSQEAVCTSAWDPPLPKRFPPPLAPREERKWSKASHKSTADWATAVGASVPNSKHTACPQAAHTLERMCRASPPLPQKHGANSHTEGIEMMEGETEQKVGVQG